MTASTTTFNIDRILEAEAMGFDLIKVTSSMGEGVRFSDIVTLASLLDVDGEPTDYKTLLSYGKTVSDIMEMIASAMESLGFTSDSRE